MNPQRLAVIREIGDLTESQCKNCENHGKNKKYEKVCASCPTYKRLRQLGEALNKISQTKKGMGKMTKQTKNAKQSTEVTEELYYKLKPGKTDGEVAKEIGVSIATLYNHKRRWTKQDVEKIPQPDKEYQKLMGDLKVQLDQKKVTVQQLQDKINELTETVTAKNQRVSELERENARLKADVETLQDDIENIECLHGAESLEQEHIAKVAETYKNELEQQVKQNQELRNRIRSTVKELAQYI